MARGFEAARPPRLERCVHPASGDPLPVQELPIAGHDSASSLARQVCRACLDRRPLSREPGKAAPGDALWQ